mgnify:CR=1 FL=1
MVRSNLVSLKPPWPYSTKNKISVQKEILFEILNMTKVRKPSLLPQPIKAMPNQKSDISDPKLNLSDEVTNEKVKKLMEILQFDEQKRVQCEKFVEIHTQKSVEELINLYSNHVAKKK